MGPYAMQSDESIIIDAGPTSTVVCLRKRNPTGETIHKIIGYPHDEWAQLSTYDFSDQLDDALSMMVETRRRPCTE